MNTEAEAGIMLPESKDAWNHLKLEEEREGSLLEDLEGARPCQLLHFTLLASSVNACCLEPPVCHFVAAALGK